ncbi:hypothetical protein AB1N83_006528 [Pleurotus pulmonarius]
MVHRQAASESSLIYSGACALAPSLIDARRWSDREDMAKISHADIKQRPLRPTPRAQLVPPPWRSRYYAEFRGYVNIPDIRKLSCYHSHDGDEKINWATASWKLVFPHSPSRDLWSGANLPAKLPAPRRVPTSRHCLPAKAGPRHLGERMLRTGFRRGCKVETVARDARRSTLSISCSPFHKTLIPFAATRAGVPRIYEEACTVLGFCIWWNVKEQRTVRVISSQGQSAGAFSALVKGKPN